jgi:hypothetical protein
MSRDTGPTAIDTMTDDIKVTIDDVMTMNNDLVARITGGNTKLLPDVKELLVSIYIRGFFTGAHLKLTDDELRSELVLEVIKSKLDN